MKAEKVVAKRGVLGAYTVAEETYFTMAARLEATLEGYKNAHEFLNNLKIHFSLLLERLDAKIPPLGNFFGGRDFRSPIISDNPAPHGSPPKTIGW